jgi:hypothetical protein
MSRELSETKSSRVGWIIVSVLVLLIGLTFLWGHSLQKKREAARQEAEQRAIVAEQQRQRTEQARVQREQEMVKKLQRLETIAKEKKDREDFERDRDATRSEYATQQKVLEYQFHRQRQQTELDELRAKNEMRRQLGR